ncbi:MAG: zinc ribbon domain-containing protein [Phycisphaerae bacterium]|nr:zinc ribbon domain-containing protein [Phycisphaerae bacterium]
MPTYEYQCDGCGHAFEQFQSITAGTLRKCPECGQMKLKRLIGTGGAVIFKGSGFYQTDYRSESYKKGAEKEKKSKEQKSGDKSKDAAKKDSTGTAKTDSTSPPKPQSDTSSSGGKKKSKGGQD